MSKGNQPKREPLLSEDRMAGLIATKTHDLPRYVGGGVRDFYENLIASGELMVVREAANISPEKPVSFMCGSCRASNGSGGGRLSASGFPYRDLFRYCPGCGAKILEA